MDSNKAVVREFVRAIGDGDLETIATLIADDIVDHHLAPNFQGRAGVLRWIEQTLAAFADVRFEVIRQVAEGPLVASMVHLTMRHVGEFAGIQPRNALIDIHSMVFDRIENGQIVERWEEFDRAALMAQLQAGPRAAP